MHYYSPSRNAFYPDALKQDYIDAGTFPDDVIEVDDDVWLVYAGNLPPEGKIRIAGEDGLPTWADLSPLTQAELTEQAEYEKQKRLQEAAKIIAPLQDAVDIGIATEAEIMKLNAWKHYRVQVNRVDVSIVPDIHWPEKPIII